jgi:chorismate lyase/3-hydroxybenzoate synthase
MGQNRIVAEPRQAVASTRAGVFSPPPPGWALDLFRGGEKSLAEDWQIHRADALALISLRIPTDDLDGEALESAVGRTYRKLRSLLESETARHPLRIWNFVPGILDPTGDGLNRYMRFNAGRYREFLSWFGDESALDAKAPAASAVGHQGHDFVLHALCGCEPAKPIANPRQRAAHRYSKKFGPIPPCFARAVAVDSARQLIIGGTASVVDEVSMHVGDLQRQLIETRENLHALVRAAFGSTADPAACIDQLRVYHVRLEDRQTIERFINPTFPRVQSIEFLQGDLCRGDLLVEIEGRATQSEI